MKAMMIIDLPIEDTEDSRITMCEDDIRADISVYACLLGSRFEPKLYKGIEVKPLPKPMLAYDKDCHININDDLELGQMRGWNSYYEKLTGIDLDEEQENE